MTRGVRLGLFISACLGVACGNPPGSPSPSPSPTLTTITITGSGASPKSVQIALGARVRFTNSDSKEHDMGSDPHPDHTDCPPLNSVGILKPGETRETGNFVIARTCGYHDHEDPTNVSLQGTIVIK